MVAPTPRISSISPNIAWADTFNAGGAVFTLSGSGLDGCGTLVSNVFGNLSVPTSIDPAELQVADIYDGNTNFPQWASYNCSNSALSGLAARMQLWPPVGARMRRLGVPPVWYAFVGDANTMAVGLDGEIYHLDGRHQYIWKYKWDLVRGLVPDGGFPIRSTGGFAISVDDVTGYVLVDTEAYDPTDGVDKVSPQLPVGKVFVTSKAKNGVAAILWMNGTVSFFPLAQSPQGWGTSPIAVTTQQPIGVAGFSDGDAHAMTMIVRGSKTFAAIYARESNTITLVDGSTATISQILTVPGVLPVSQIPGWNGRGGGGEPQFVGFSSGPAAGTLALLTPDQVLTMIHIPLNDGSSMTILSQVKLDFGENVYPFRLAADEAHGTVGVALADPINVVSRRATATTTGVVTRLAGTSPLLAGGFGISPDGTQMYACMTGLCGAFGAVRPMPRIVLETPETAPTAIGAMAPASRQPIVIFKTVLPADEEPVTDDRRTDDDSADDISPR